MMDAIDNPKQTQTFCTIKVSDYIKKNHKENKIRVGDDRKENDQQIDLVIKGGCFFERLADYLV